MQQKEQHKQYWKNMATRLHSEGRYAEALRMYRQAILKNPEDADLCYNLGNLLRAIGQYDKAIGVYKLAHRLNPEDPDILMNLAPLYRSSQKLEAATECYEKILELDPLNVTAQYFLAALRGEVPAQAPRAYIVELFDQYASTYDQHMDKVLKYQAPELLQRLLLSYKPARLRRFSTCDLGCGTGRSMQAFEQLITTVDGYDLSPLMLQEAAEKNIYRQLIAGDCVETLLASAYSYELFVAADLVPYIGELNPLFAAVREKAKSQAFFLISTEFQATGQSPQLLTTGRYQHSLAYMQSCLRAHNLKLRAFQIETLRTQAQQPIHGGLYLIEV